MVSTMDNQKRNIMIALGAGMALIGAAVLYSMTKESAPKDGNEPTAEESDDEVADPEIDDDLVDELIKKDKLDTAPKVD
jgi:hypothetical protein